MMLCRSREAPKRTAVGSNPLLAQFCNRLYQGQVWLLGNQSQNLVANSSSDETLAPRGFGA
jgi:hypothetical protein